MCLCRRTPVSRHSLCYTAVPSFFSSLACSAQFMINNCNKCFLSGMIYSGSVSYVLVIPDLSVKLGQVHSRRINRTVLRLASVLKLFLETCIYRNQRRVRLLRSTSVNCTDFFKFRRSHHVWSRTGSGSTTLIEILNFLHKAPLTHFVAASCVICCNVIVLFSELALPSRRTTV